MARAKVNDKENLEEYKGFLVVGEQKFGVISPVTYELLGEARKLADSKNEKLEVLLMGYGMDEEIAKLAKYGADKVIYFEHELLATYTTDAFFLIMTEKSALWHKKNSDRFSLIRAGLNMTQTKSGRPCLA